MSLNVGLSNKTGNNLSRGLNMVESSLRVFNNMNRLHKYTLAKRLEPFFSLRRATIASASLRGAKFNSLQNTELRHKFATAATFGSNLFYLPVPALLRRSKGRPGFGLLLCSQVA